MKKKKRYRLGEISQYFLIIMTIIFSGYYYVTINSKLELLMSLIICIYMYILLKTKGRIKVDINQLFLLLFFLCNIGITFIISKDENYNNYLLIILFILSGYIVNNLISLDEFIEKYQKILKIIVLISLVGYFLNQISFLNFLPILKNINNVYYKSGLIFTWIQGIENRNCGIFWEPGLFATVIIWGILFEIIFSKKVNKKRLVLYYMTLFTVNSSAGYLLGGLSIFLIILKNSNDKIQKKIIVQIVVFLLFILVLIYLDSILVFLGAKENEILSKLFVNNIIENTRFKVIEYNIKNYLKSPIIGNGFSSIYNTKVEAFDVNTSFNLMALFGIGGIFYNLVFIRGILKNSFLNIMSKIILIIIIFIILNKEPHHRILLTWVILFYLSSNSVKYKNIKQGDKKNEKIWISESGK